MRVISALNKGRLPRHKNAGFRSAGRNHYSAKYFHRGLMREYCQCYLRLWGRSWSPGRKSVRFSGSQESETLAARGTHTSRKAIRPARTLTWMDGTGVQSAGGRRGSSGPAGQLRPAGPDKEYIITPTDVYKENVCPSKDDRENAVRPKKMWRWNSKSVN